MPDININIHRQTKSADDTPQQDTVWPTMLGEEEDEPTLVELTFCDYATVKDNDGNWTDIADWYNDDLTSVLWQQEKTFTENKPFHINPKKTTYKVYGNVDSKVRTTCIAEEFSPDNEDRWERKPLATRPLEWRFDGNRWYIGGTYMFLDPGTGQTKIASDFSQYNIKVELRSNPDSQATAVIDPDSFHDGKSRRLNMKFAHDVGEIRPLTYRGNFPGQRLGIKVKDQSKSFGHYVSGVGLSYAYDWIDNGIYFCEFDTTDTEHYKVTMEPSFASDEVSGRMISPGKYEVGLIPRRWLYEFRYRHQVNPDTDFEENTYPPDMSLECRMTLSWRADNQALKAYTVGNTLKAWYVQSTHYVVSFWGRPPCNFTAQWFHEEDQPQAEDTAKVRFYNDSGVVIGTTDLIWSETFEQAQAHLLDAGGSQDDANELFTGGLSGNLHVCSDNTAYLVKIGTASEESIGTLSQIASTCIGGPVITRSEAGYVYQGLDLSSLPSQEFGLKRLWKVIEDSKAWTDLIKPLRDKALAMDGASAASRIDMIPWGVGISPSKAGDLVGVVRIREKAYFVWRKTDEEFTPKVVGSDRHPIRFESNSSDGKLGAFWEGNYGDFFEEGEENVYDSDYCDLFVGDSARKVTHVGREVSSTPNEMDENCNFLYSTYAAGEAEGAVQLDAPVFVMLTKERAFSDIDFTDEEWFDDATGWNLRLLKRCARCNAFDFQPADVRNSY